MIKRRITAFIVFVSTFFIVSHGYAQLQFVENKGQWDKRITYKSDFETGAFFLEKDGFTVFMYQPDDLQNFSEYYHHGASKINAATNGTDKLQLKPTATSQPATSSGVLRSHAYKLNFVGGNNNPVIVADKVISTYNNYYIGNDKSKWQSNCKIYQGITYKNVYPNIDVRYYTSAGYLKYDFIVRPGGNVDDIKMQYAGVNKLSVKNNELIIGTSIGDSKELYPYTYQLNDEGRQTLDCKYVVKGNTVQFTIKDYQPNATIVIDPTLIFSTFTGSTADNWGYTATPGPDGSMFAAGIVFDFGYPTSPGAFQQNFNSNGTGDDQFGVYDIGIIKLSSNGANRIYGTYLGGSRNEQPHSMICDKQGNLIVAGRTLSSDYPTKNAQGGGSNVIGTGGGYDIFITKFNFDGTALIGSVRIGGSGDDGVNVRPKYIGAKGAESIRRNYGDDARSEVIVDPNGNVYLASCTRIDGSGNNFPIKNTSVQNSFGGGNQDGVVLKFSPDLSVLNFSTYFGGSGDDACFVLAVSPTNGDVYVAGGTASSDLPGNKTNVLSATYRGGATDGFITELKSDGSGIVHTTYVGTGGVDIVYGIQFDKYGYPYIMGTTSGTWPVINAIFSNPNSKQFIGKLQTDLSGYVYSTVFGNGSADPNISPVAFLVDRCQNVYVSGWGGELNSADDYPSAGTSGLPLTANAIQQNTDGSDFYFFVLERDATSQLFGSYYGQIGGFPDHVDGGTSRFDANGVIYQAMCANCAITGEPNVNFPTTPGVWSSRNRSRDCNEAAVKIEMDFTGVAASIKSTINGRIDTAGCVPLDIVFTDTLAKGKQYRWNFGDGTTEIQTIVPTATHTFTTTGYFKVRLISIDSSTCNIADTVYINVHAGSNIIDASFTPAKVGGCQSLTYQFNNTTTAVIPVYTDSSFIWDFGDGSPEVKANKVAVTHTFPSAGTYKVMLIADDTTFCNSPDTAILTLNLAMNVKAAFTTPAKGCSPYTAVITNTSLAGTEFNWDFGDGTTSTSTNPTVTHLYSDTGTYTIRLIAKDISTCNLVDTTYFTIMVVQKPTATFTYSPDPSKENTPTEFTNASVNATHYVWNFGDGDTSILVNPIHQYNASTTFHTCLVALNDVGCADTTCQDITAIVLPLLDVPNAFTPGKFGTNSVIKVVGFGIGKMDWKIYNRWGQLIFQSNDKDNGWDGTFKGALQPMDVYTYTLDVEFTNGKKYRKTGDISLLR
ncbi:DUF7948 domain-containing protein [Ferruginibacter albus]|uniref:DUF7948 domain-containing protein n=1 Tax=Ferruginibacter albus TaxID=2875540 RepID=UPI001CC6875A|nr:PKD domain-containing protein [Ferruginibacter albus]UAY52682.1 PKD domain-containing protein [Ferruginibacter albus]